MQAIAADIWDRGGILGAVCHGPVLLPGVIDFKTEKSVIASKTVTGFTTEGEMVLNVLDRLKIGRGVDSLRGYQQSWSRLQFADIGL